MLSTLLDPPLEAHLSSVHSLWIIGAIHWYRGMKMNAKANEPGMAATVYFVQML